MPSVVFCPQVRRVARLLSTHRDVVRPYPTHTHTHTHLRLRCRVSNKRSAESCRTRPQVLMSVKYRDGGGLGAYLWTISHRPGRADREYNSDAVVAHAPVSLSSCLVGLRLLVGVALPCIAITERCSGLLLIGMLPHRYGCMFSPSKNPRPLSSSVLKAQDIVLQATALNACLGNRIAVGEKFWPSGATECGRACSEPRVHNS